MVGLLGHNPRTSIDDLDFVSFVDTVAAADIVKTD